MTTRRMGHVPLIDTWRGLSVILVVLHHVGIRFPLTQTAMAPWLPVRLMKALNWNGHDGVMIFFVISGFLITQTTLDRNGTPADVDLRGFWVRRFARIAPPLVLLVAVLSVAHLLRLPHHTIDLERQSLGLAILSAFTFWLNVYEGRTGYLPGGWDVLWSLSIEELFYLGFPFLLLVTRTPFRLALTLVPFALLLPVFHATSTGEIWRDKATLTGMATIATGVVAALAARRLAGAVARDRVLIGLGTTLLVGCLGWGDLIWPVLGEATQLLFVAGVGLILIGAYGRRDEEPWRFTAPLRAVGRLSYEIYLTHMFVVFALVELIAHLGGERRDGWTPYVPALLGSYALGWLFARGWSEPWNHRLCAWLLPPRPNVTEPL